MLGRTTQTIAAYTDGVTPVTANTNQTTTFTYDGDDHVTTRKAVMPTGADQTTAYVYGITVAAGSTFYSNDLLRPSSLPRPLHRRRRHRPLRREELTCDALGGSAHHDGPERHDPLVHPRRAGSRGPRRRHRAGQPAWTAP